jgi:hypothetical protein
MAPVAGILPAQGDSLATSHGAKGSSAHAVVAWRPSWKWATPLEPWTTE